jgi:pilus assembly protein Flp/PilA
MTKTDRPVPMSYWSRARIPAMMPSLPALEGAESRPEGGEHRMTLITSWLSSVLDREDGQGLAEYALILALIAIVAIIALLFLGTQISTILSTIGNAV